MWSGEITGHVWIVSTSPTSLEFSVPAEHADSTTRPFRFRIRCPGPPTQFGDEHIVPVVQEHVAGPGKIRPLLQECSIRSKPLQAAVFTIGDHDAAVTVHRDAVRKLELSRTASRFPP